MYTSWKEFALREQVFKVGADETLQLANIFHLFLPLKLQSMKTDLYEHISINSS